MKKSLIIFGELKLISYHQSQGQAPDLFEVSKT